MFQLVFAHPDLGGGEGALKCGTAEGACVLRSGADAKEWTPNRQRDKGGTMEGGLEGGHDDQGRLAK